MFNYKFNFLSASAALAFALTFFASSCQLPAPQNSKPQDPIADGFKREQPLISQSKSAEKEEARESRSSRQNRCREGELKSDEVSISELDYIDSGNVDSYILQGRCSERNELVYVTVNGYRLSNNPKCDSRRWKVSLNLTSLAGSEESITFRIEHNGDEICQSSPVAFLAPTNYIAIPSLEDYYESVFYVMKYEAKLEGRDSSSKAVSKASGKPITEVNHEEASALCRKNGSRYQLMKNSQWQNIARAIESVDENWASGRSDPSDNNRLNCGVVRGSPQAASSNDRDDCAAGSCSSGWDESRRTHILPNEEEKIWDMCGNAGEIMKDEHSGSVNFDDYIWRLSTTLKDKFGPRSTYRLVDSGRRSNNWNLGYAKIKRGRQMIIRGLPGNGAGIFSVEAERSQASKRGYGRDIGFRCVFNP